MEIVEENLIYIKKDLKAGFYKLNENNRYMLQKYGNDSRTLEELDNFIFDELDTLDLYTKYKIISVTNEQYLYVFNKLNLINTYIIENVQTIKDLIIDEHDVFTVKTTEFDKFRYNHNSHERNLEDCPLFIYMLDKYNVCLGKFLKPYDLYVSLYSNILFDDLGHIKYVPDLDMCKNECFEIEDSQELYFIDDFIQNTSEI
jgi:hypothetical protein